MLPSKRFCKLLLALSLFSTLFASLKEYQQYYRQSSRFWDLRSRLRDRGDVYRNAKYASGDVEGLRVNLTFPTASQNDQNASASSASVSKSVQLLERFLHCDTRPNSHTNHVRLSEGVQNISLITPQNSRKDDRKLFNPTIIALPSWSKNEYLLVSRVVTEGLHQESLICEANTCHAPGIRSRKGEQECSEEDLKELGPSGGLRCSTEPQVLNIPPTPAQQCDSKWRAIATIPGFHDPRIFWSGKGEPLVIVNSHSQYACLGLWIQDLRSLYPPLAKLLDSPQRPGGPLMSYQTLTELTRSPSSTRNPVEKNWFLFFPTKETSFIHYDIAPRCGRAFAKLIGSGLTTPNLTDAAEPWCLSDEADNNGDAGEWHQASNSLKLILCSRADSEMGNCEEEEDGRAVHLALVHRKFTNKLDLPMRYERHFVIWSSQFPFHVLAVSEHPVLLANETASGWSVIENWAQGAGGAESHTDQGQSRMGRRHRVPKRSTAFENISTTDLLDSAWANSTLIEHGSGRVGKSDSVQEAGPQPLAYFSYTPSINWAHRQTRQHNGKWMERELTEMQIGYLDDEIILGIGLDDVGQAFARVTAQSLLSCLRICRIH